MTAESSQDNDDLEALIGEGQLMIAGERITVRKYPFLAAMRLESECRPLLDDLAAVLSDSDADDEPARVSYGPVMDVFAKHEDLMVLLLCAATGKPTDWVAGLDDDDGYDLMMALWGVNHPFFIRRVLMTILPAKIQKSVSPVSSPRS